MKLLIFSYFMLASFGASAECWVVKDMKGANYAARNGYAFENDGFSGTFMISVDGKKASVRYSGNDAGGVEYGVISPNTIVGISDGENGKLIETWFISPDGNVKMTKMINGFGDFDSVKAMVGKVSGKC